MAPRLMPLAFPSITRVVIDSRGAVVSVVAADPMEHTPSVMRSPNAGGTLTPARCRLKLRKGDRARVVDTHSRAGRWTLDRSPRGLFRRHVRSGRDSELIVTIVCDCGRKSERPFTTWARKSNVDGGCAYCARRASKGTGLLFGDGIARADLRKPKSRKLAKA